MPRRNWDGCPMYHVVVTRRDGSQLILETYPDRQKAVERAAVLAALEDVLWIGVSEDHAHATHRKRSLS